MRAVAAAKEDLRQVQTVGSRAKAPDDVLCEAERRGEIVSALFRLAISAALLVLVIPVGSATHAHHPLLVVAGYGLVSAGVLLLALRRFFHPALPFALVTLDFAVLAGAMLMVAKMTGVPPALAWTLPIFPFGLVLLIHASLRYRPWLVLYGAGLFVAALLAGDRLLDAALPDAKVLASFGHDAAELWAAPPVLVGLAAVLLFYSGLRTRRLFNAALVEGERVARLSRFFSPEVARRLADAEPGPMRRTAAAVMFVDIRGFTRLAESVPPERLGDLLAEFRSRVGDAVLGYGGTIDKFLGDGVLAVFGTPEPRPDDATQALGAAFAILNAVRDWAPEHRVGRSPAVGIGIHYGELFTGVIGRGWLLEHTVIGDTVNLAERLERFTRRLPASVVVSGEFARVAGIPDGDPDWRRLGAQPLEGHAAPVEVLCYGAMTDDR